MYEILINVLVFCAILLLIALIVGTVQMVIVMIDVRRTSKKVTKKVETVTSLLDIGSLLLGGVEGAKKKMTSNMISKSNFAALIAGIRKGLQVLFKKEGGEKDG